MRFLSPDSGLMRGLGDLVDAIWINILMLVTSLPLVTVGAALSAGFDTARRSLAGEGGGVTRNYFRAFRANLIKATALWLPFLVIGAGVAYSWIVLRITPLLVPKFGLTVLWVIGFEWAFALQSRFENPVGRTLANAYVFGVTRFGYTLAMVAIDAVWIALLVACWFYLPQGLFLLVVMGYGTATMLHVPVFERAMKAYLSR
ncbi:beta-carotene 15,15'-monooxygenase [Bifidobacterium rousetti]|uniref:YesL family protein n=1 Tax=Bifidobacterium rousetti TaxID=2045439 RepID=UPI0012392FF1|nr:YesL family protein [Bifidobacterium rousetti]KAA8818725.1 beta-carotene 15,15'-monooxygenase [Bifidobacterium rousetti]